GLRLRRLLLLDGAVLPEEHAGSDRRQVQRGPGRVARSSGPAGAIARGGDHGGAAGAPLARLPARLPGERDQDVGRGDQGERDRPAVAGIRAACAAHPSRRSACGRAPQDEAGVVEGSKSETARCRVVCAQPRATYYGCSPTRAMINDLWYKNAVIYCLSVGTYMDADGDGVGDFKGLLRRLDYLHGLGVTAIWLMPFQTSPCRDDAHHV